MKNIITNSFHAEKQKTKKRRVSKLSAIDLLSKKYEKKYNKKKKNWKGGKWNYNLKQNNKKWRLQREDKDLN